MKTGYTNGVAGVGLLVVLFFTCQSCKQSQPFHADTQCPEMRYHALPAPPLTEEDVDAPAKPIGGLAAIVARVEYPKSALRDRVHGEVIVQFVVDTTGCVLNAEVLSGPDSRLNEEALRVMQFTRFEPAQKAGKPVMMITSLPVTFKVR